MNCADKRENYLHYIYRNFSPKKKIWIFLGGGKKPIGFFKKKTIWFKPRLKPLGLNRANPAKNFKLKGHVLYTLKILTEQLAVVNKADFF